MSTEEGKKQHFPGEGRESFRQKRMAVSALRAKRIDIIIELMAKGEWTRFSHKELAKDWDVPPERVRIYSAEASRMLRGAMTGDREKWREWALSTLRGRILPEAMRTRQLNAAVSAIREAKEILGLSAPVRIDITGHISQMSNDEIYAQLEDVRRRAIALMAEKEAEPIALLGEGDDEDGITDAEFEEGDESDGPDVVSNAEDLDDASNETEADQD